MTSEQIHALLNFEIPLEVSGVPDPTLFLPREDDRPLTRQETDWVRNATAEIKENPERAPEIIQAVKTAPALRALERSLERFSGPMPATKEQWQNFVMAKYYEQAVDIDPKISKPALDALAKTNIVGLHVEQQEINIKMQSSIELESTLLDAIKRYSSAKVIEGESEVVSEAISA